EGGMLVVEVTRHAGETMLAKIVRLVEQAQEERAPAQHFIDRFAHPYTLAVLAATGLVALLPPLLGDTPWGDAFYRAMTLLVVASPCALVISTPSAILSAMANGARYGILFKGGAYLDLAGTIDTIAFDKTGTLTRGEPRLVALVAEADLVPAGGGGGWRDGREPVTSDRLLALAAALERPSEHHLARATVEAALERGLEIADVEDFTALPGEGVHGRVEGEHIWAGNLKMAERMGAEPDPLLLGWAAGQTSRSRSVVYVGTEGAVLGALAFGDTLPPNAAATVRHLKYEGIRWITVLSGDHPDAGRAVAAELGADEVKAGLLPHEKVEAVRALVARSAGVGMVGDGVNDAPAMATATLGIAMGAAGTDVAIETADVVLMSDEIEKVDYIIHLGKRARRVVRQNVFFCRGHGVARSLAHPRHSTGCFAGCMPMFHGSSSSGPSFDRRVDRLDRAAEIRREQVGVDLGHHFDGVAEEHCDLLDLYVGSGKPRGERVTQAVERESVAAAAVLEPRSLEGGAGPIELRGERERLVLSGQADEVAIAGVAQPDVLGENAVELVPDRHVANGAVRLRPPRIFPAPRLDSDHASVEVDVDPRAEVDDLLAPEPSEASEREHRRLRCAIHH